MNPVILVAIIVQVIIAKVNRMAGAAIGFIITTGILIWGISIYSEGNAIAFFGNALPKGVFIIAIIVWYIFDWRELSAARKAAEPERSKEFPVESENSSKSVQNSSETRKIDKAGTDQKESVWTCRCGTDNPLTLSNCSNCHINKYNVIGRSEW